MEQAASRGIGDEALVAVDEQDAQTSDYAGGSKGPSVMSDKFNEPNVIIPLAMSYDTRGLGARAYINAFPGGKDQRKVNCYYQLIRNAITGQITIEIVKRPGIKDSGKTFGESGYTQYCISNVLSSESAGSWVAYSNGSTTKIADGSTVGSITSTKIPVYLDKTIISGTPTAILQLRATSGAPPAYDTYYSTSVGTWTLINDAVYAGLTHVGKIESLDGFSFVMTNNNRIYNFNINSISVMSATNFITKQIQQDRACGLALYKNTILSFGAETVEFFRNAGNPSGSPLSAIPQMAEKIGMGLLGDPNQLGSVTSTTSYTATLGGKLYFVGRKGGSALLNMSVFAYNGTTFEKVSTGAIDRIISDINTGYIYAICSVSFYGESAIAIQLSAPGTATQQWLMYFPDRNDWFEWNSDVFSPINDGRFFLSSATSATKSYRFQAASADTWQDDATTFGMGIQFRIPKKGNDRDFMRWCALDADTTTTASNVTVKFSDDDYQTFDAGRTIDINTKEKRLMRCGSYKSRVVYLEHSGNLEFRARNFLARIE